LKYLIIIIETALIALYIDFKNSNLSVYTYLSLEENYNSSHYQFDIIDNKILTLENVAEDQKIKVWKESFIKEEILDFFPNMEIMKEIYNDRVTDDGLFKERFLEYMIELQDSYIAGEIEEEGFKKAFSNPSF